MSNLKRAAMAVLAMFAFVTLTACGGVNLSSTQTALHFKGGAIQAQAFDGCVKPSERDNFAPGDKFYVYQTDLRSFDATGGDRAEANPIEVLSVEKEVVRIPVTVSFNLKADCKTLLDFHNTIGAKNWHEGKGAYNDGDTTGQGWVNFLNHVYVSPLNTTLDALSEKQKFMDLIGKEDVRQALENEIKENLPAQIAKRTGGKQFFENFEIQVLKPQLANQAILDAIAAQNAAVEQGRQAEAKAVADGKAAIATAEAARQAAAKNAEAARAQVAVAAAEAAKRRAEIQGYGSAAEYNRAQAIEKGLNPYQPTYVVPQGGPTQ